MAGYAPCARRRVEGKLIPWCVSQGPPRQWGIEAHLLPNDDGQATQRAQIDIVLLNTEQTMLQHLEAPPSQNIPTVVLGLQERGTIVDAVRQLLRDIDDQLEQVCISCARLCRTRVGSLSLECARRPG